MIIIINRKWMVIMQTKRVFTVVFGVLLGAAAFPAFADETPTQTLTLKNHAFVPPALTVPANQKVKLIVKNEDAEAAEFESYELNREKVVPANGEITVYLDPLDPGTYPYFDD